jgi:hypothetical protein
MLSDAISNTVVLLIWRMGDFWVVHDFTCCEGEESAKISSVTAARNHDAAATGMTL